MKTQSLILLVLFRLLLLLVASRSTSSTFDKITVHEFELIDANGTKRASIKVEPGGEVVFRLQGEKGTIRVKLGAKEEGSGFVLLDDATNPGLHALAKNDGTSLILTGRDGKKLVKMGRKESIEYSRRWDSVINYLMPIAGYVV